MSRLERDVKAEVMLALGAHADTLIFDNPSGMARYPGGAAVPYGVGLRHRGGSDLIGIFASWAVPPGAQVPAGLFAQMASRETGARSVVRDWLEQQGLTPVPVGIFLAIEIKSATGRQRDEQRAFEAAVRARGGEYALIRSGAEALAWLEDLRRRHG